jgi:hypothetical protein
MIQSWPQSCGSQRSTSLQSKSLEQVELSLRQKLQARNRTLRTNLLQLHALNRKLPQLCLQAQAGLQGTAR